MCCRPNAVFSNDFWNHFSCCVRRLCPAIRCGREYIQKTLAHSEKGFEIRASQKVDYFFEISADDDGECILLHNKPVVENLRTQLSMEEFKLASTPLASGLTLSKDGGGDLVGKTPHRQLIRLLLHLPSTGRPYTALAGGYFLHFTHRHSVWLWKAAKQMLRYLKWTADFELYYPWERELPSLFSYSSAGWNQESPRKMAISIGLTKHASSCVSWSSKQQTIVAQSLKKAEVLPLASCIQDVLWFEMFPVMMRKVPVKTAVEWWSDICIDEGNPVFIAAAKTPIPSELSKHVDLKYQSLVEIVQKESLWLRCARTENIVANTVTNNLSAIKSCRLAKLAEVKWNG